MLRPMSGAIIMDIDVTNACTHRCSNCTRLLGHIRKPYFMDFETYRKAVDSLLDHRGCVALIGGEPCIHPEFEKLARYLREAMGAPPLNNGLPAMADIVAYRNKYFHSANGKKRGLFTSLGEGFYDNMEVVWETFDFLGINDHSHDGEHQAVLIAADELPISEEQFLKNRDNCWLQHLWSPTINNHGAYFCEIVASLDGLFNQGRMAWPIEKGWWKRDPKDWKDQLTWCRKCGIAQNSPSRVANEGVDDVTPKMLEMLKAVDSPKVRQGKYQVFDVSRYDKNGNCARSTELYLPKGDNKVRMDPTNRSVYPKKLEALTVSVGCADFLDLTLGWNVGHFDKYVVVTSSEDIDTQNVVKKYGATLVISDRYKENKAPFNKGKMLNDGMAVLDYSDWVLMTDADVLIPSNFRAEFDNLIWNPGLLYYATRLHTPAQNAHEWVQRYHKDENLVKTLHFSDPHTNQKPWGYFQMFNCRAEVLKGLERKVCSENFVSAGGVDKHFEERWHHNRQQLAPFTVIHIAHGGMGSNWTGRRSAPLHFAPTNPIQSDQWLNIGWLDERGYNITYPENSPGFIKLIRVDTGDFVIGRSAPPPRGEFVKTGGFRYNAHHVGLVASRLGIPSERKFEGTIIIHNSGRREYSGWGMGHVMFKDDKQGYVWDGKEIPPTKFDVFWKRSLTQAERELQVRV